MKKRSNIGYVGVLVVFSAFFSEAADLNIRYARTVTVTNGVYENVRNAGTLIKDGSGTLTIRRPALGSGTVDVLSGDLVLEDGVVASYCPEQNGLAFWLDANKNVTLSGTDVTVWNDVRENAGGTVWPRAVRYGEDAVPELVPPAADTFNNAVLDFGKYGSGRWLQWQTADGEIFRPKTIRTVFLALSCTNGAGFFLGDWTGSLTDRGVHDFAMGWQDYNTVPGPGEASWWRNDFASASVASTNVNKNGGNYVNGMAVDGCNARIPAKTIVFSLQTYTNDVTASNFGNDRYYRTDNSTVTVNRQGGGRIGEVLIYTNYLNNTSRKKVEDYLIAKWGKGNIRLAKGTMLTCSADALNNLNVKGDGLVNVLSDRPVARESATPFLVTGGIVLDNDRRAAISVVPTSGALTIQTENGLCSVATNDSHPGTLVKTGGETLTLSSVASNIASIHVQEGALRLSVPFSDRQSPNILADGTFGEFSATDETIMATNNGYKSRPEGSGWTFENASGICRRGSAYCADIPLPEGDTVAYLQQYTVDRAPSISRSFTTERDGVHSVSFFVAARQKKNGFRFSVTICKGSETNLIGDVRSHDYDRFTKVSCVTKPLIAGETYTLLFRCIDVQGDTSQDGTALLDAVEIRHAGTCGDIVLEDAGFEQGELKSVSKYEFLGVYATYQYNPAGSPWLFDSLSLISEGRAFPYHGDAPFGGRLAMIKQTGSIHTPVTFPSAGDYRISLSAGGFVRTYVYLSGAKLPFPYFGYAGHTFSVNLVSGGTTNRLGKIQTSGVDGFSEYSFDVTITNNAPLEQVLCFTGLTTTENKASLLDNVSIRSIRAPVKDAGFEAQAVIDSDAGYIYAFKGTAWSFLTASGIARKSWGFLNTAPEGSCYAILQKKGRFMHTNIVFAVDGAYDLSFKAASRMKETSVYGHDFKVLFDGMEVARVVTPDSSWRTCTFRLPYALSNTLHTLEFAGINQNDDVDRTSLIDDVRIEWAGDPVTVDPDDFNKKTVLELDEDTVLELDYKGTIRIDSLLYNGRSYSGVRSAANTPFIRGSGSLFISRKGTIITVL